MHVRDFSLARLTTELDLELRRKVAPPHFNFFRDQNYQSSPRTVNDAKSCQKTVFMTPPANDIQFADVIVQEDASGIVSETH